MKKYLVVVAATAAALSLSACAPKIGGNDYSVRGAGEVSETVKGTIISMHVVNISAKTAENQSGPGAGALIGGLTGGVLGSQVGKGRGPAVIGVAGALGGAALGHYAEGKLTEQEGFEYQIQLDSGGIVTVTQGAEPRLAVGQKVLVIKSNRDRSRVVAA
ncbi:MAG: glycine zipper 2TM domain-containing protein [Alphaproteobacteria bacterium]